MLWILLLLFNSIPVFLLARLLWKAVSKDKDLLIGKSDLILAIGAACIIIVEGCFFIWAFAFVSAWAQY
jgi:hypothetical protein